MGIKRKGSFKANKKAKRSAWKRKSKTGVTAVVKKMLRSHDKKMLETKMSQQTTVDGIEIFHNNFVTLTATPFATLPGLGGDPMTGTGNRIGDEVTPKGYSFRMMVELNERYSDVTYRLMMVKSAKGDVPTRATLYAGESSNKMLDKINTERYSILYQKYFKMKSPPFGSNGALGVGVGSGAVSVSDRVVDATTLSRATKIVSGFIPAKKFTTRGVLKYEDNSTNQVKFFDYNLVLYAYSNYSTLQDIYYVARVGEFIGTMSYTDA